MSENMDGCSNNTDCYSFVQKSDVQPYFDIATTYEFANYMFQTNEGPSFEAHQFIFAGSSAPVGKTNQTYFDWFAVDNPALPFRNNTGCSSIDPGEAGYVTGIKWDGTTKSGSNQHPWYIPLPPPPLDYSYPCYEHRTLADLLDDNRISWKYYAPKEGSIWTAPTAIQHICGTVDTNPCPGFQTGGQYANNVIFEHGAHTAPIIEDINSCNLAAVSWVIPDFKWSDHPAGVQNGSGPSYVANIVNAIGQDCGYWNNTAIFIIWDDWGGWYDHVNPANAPGLSVKLNCPTSSWGCGNTYGFRVPLLVVSPWTGIKHQDGTYSGYISGNTITQGEVFPYIHDFGSILAYIEYNFLGAGGIGGINVQNNYYLRMAEPPIMFRTAIFRCRISSA
jgi:phospholipase C